MRSQCVAMASVAPTSAASRRRSARPEMRPAQERSDPLVEAFLSDHALAQGHDRLGGVDGSERGRCVGGPAQHLWRDVGRIGHCVVRVAYHRFQSSFSPGRANPHDGSARVRCGFK